MKQRLIFLISIFLFAGCAILKPTPKAPEIQLTDQQFISLITESTQKLLSSGWLSDFLTTNSKRPILMVSKIENEANVLVNINTAYDIFESEFIQSGQVRVVKTDDSQRLINPSELVNGKSVDFVVSAKFEKNKETSPAITIFVVSLWGDDSNLPIIEFKKELEPNLSEY